MSQAAAARESRDSLVPFGAISFTYFAAIGLFNPYAPLWFQSLGMSTLAIGAISSLQAWTRVIGPYGWSWAGDRLADRSTLLRIATALTLLFAAALWFGRSAAALSVIVFLLFMANGGVVPLSEAALAQRLAGTGSFDVGRYGRVRMWGSVGFLASVGVFGVVLQASGIQALPLFAILMFGLLALAAWRLPHQAAPAQARQAAAAGSAWSVLRRPVVAWFFAGVFFTVLAHTALYAFLSLYLVSQGYGKSAVGALWAVSVVAEIAFFWSQGRWFARWSVYQWLVAAAAASVLRFSAMAALGSWWGVLVAAQALHAVTFAAQHAACIAIIDRHFAGPLRGRGQALYTTLGYGLSGVIGGVAGGALSDRFGLATVFGAAAVMAAVALACCLRSAALARATAD